LYFFWYYNIHDAQLRFLIDYSVSLFLRGAPMSSSTDMTDQNADSRPPSRRQTLALGAAVVLGSGLMTGVAFAGATKMAQSAVAYQAKPQGAARCDICTQWQAPNACKLVSGVISPTGWCTVYAPASKS
jgi:hypothetical protein